MRDAAEALGTALVAGIDRYCRATTEEFRRLARELEGPACAAHSAVFEELDTRHAQDRWIGWSLGVVAAAAGTDLLRERREPEGLGQMLRVVSDAVGANGLEPTFERVPRLSTSIGAGWELPFLAGVLVAGADARTAVRWHFELAGGRASLLVRGPAGALDALTPLIADSHALRVGDWSGLSVPSSWFERG